jgi:ribokinase
MPSTVCKKELQSFLEAKAKEPKVVVMPDFFLDRIVSLDYSVSKFSAKVTEVANRKGGNIDGISQTDLRGGNAINVASALTQLGAQVTPIISTSQYGLHQIKYMFNNIPIDFSHIKISKAASITTALEFKNKTEKTNVMLRDLGALEEFGPSDLDEYDYRLIQESNYVCLFNWAGTLKNGTALSKAVFERAKRRGIGKTYYDTADPTNNAKQIPKLIEEVLTTSLVDVLSVNENEAITFASFFDSHLREKETDLEFAELAMEAARVLAKHLTARIDLHTTVFSATLQGKAEVVVPAFEIKVLRATGAGDAWDAGNIFGDFNGLSDECRLMLANAVSACYLSSATGSHPKKEELVYFLKNNP